MKMPSPRLRRQGLVAILGLVAIGAVVLSTAAASPERSRHASPRLSLIRLSPATVAGHGFGRHDRVHIRLTTAQTLSRAVFTSRAGAFKVDFSTVIDRCSAWSITANVRDQPAVVLRGPAKPACAPARTP